MSRRRFEAKALTRRRLRVVWVYKVFDVGGAERLLLEINRHVRDCVDIVPVALTSADGEMAQTYRAAGLQPIGLGTSSPWSMAWVASFRRLIRRLDPDLVHFHAPYPAAFGRLSMLSLGVPIVYTEHNVWPNYHPLTRIANTITYPLNSAAIAVSSGVRASQVRSLAGRLATRGTQTIPNGVDLAALDEIAASSYGVEHPAYGCVSHLRQAKGIDTLLRAAAGIRQRVPNVRGYVVGDGEHESRLRALRDDLHATDVAFLGFRRDARAITRMLDVFVVPSRQEGLPVAMLEAMAFGKAVVATRVGGIPEVIKDRVNGLLVEPDDPNALADAVVELLGHPALAKRMGAQARATVERSFSAETMASEILRVYRSVAHVA